jgi:hypothetical protein
LNIKVSQKDQAGERQQLLLTTAEPGILHVPLHDADQGLWVGEVRIGNLALTTRS